MLAALLVGLAVTVYSGAAGSVAGRLKEKHGHDDFASFMLALAWPLALPFSVGYARTAGRLKQLKEIEECEERLLMEASGELAPTALATSHGFAVVCECGYRSVWHSEDMALGELESHAEGCHNIPIVWARQD